jgi:hypothetical protein
LRQSGRSPKSNRLDIPTIAKLFQLIEPVIMTIEAVFVHFDNAEQPGRTLGDLSDQFCCPVKLAIVLFAFQR